MMMNKQSIPVEVVYATAQRQYLWQGYVPAGTTARAAIAYADVGALFPQIDCQTVPIGVCGRKVADDTVLHAWDRVELYRPLLIDPKENRRRRARQKSFQADSDCR